MPHSVEHSISFRSDSLLPKRATSFPLQLPGKWLINQTPNKPFRSSPKETETTTTIHQPHDPSKTCLSWVTTLLHECSTAINEKIPSKTNQLLWLLNEFATPYGDHDQRLAYYFLHALFARAHNSAPSRSETLKCVAEKSYCFNEKMKLILKFQEVSPWTTFGHVASNGVILEALEGENSLHIIDLSNTTLCTQWPILIEALATRYDETPSLRLTLVATTSLERILVNEVSQRMEKFARLMGVPFKLDVISGLSCLEELKKDDLRLQEGEAIVVNCIQALQKVQVDKRVVVIDMIKSINPKIITIVEEDVNLTNTRNDFVKSFEECLRYYELYFEMLDESFNTISSNRLRLEKEQARNITRVLACEDNSHEIGGDNACYWMPNGAMEWTKLLKQQAFCSFQYSDEVVSDVKALLRRYKDGYWDVIELQKDHNNNNDNKVGIQLTWRNEGVVWACAWKP